MSMEELAVNGGTPIRTQPFPPREPFGHREEQLLVEALRSQNLFGKEGTKVRQLEQEFAEFFKVEYAQASTSGTAAIHTANVDRAMTFLSRIKSGVASINGGTYGSEPHMPFGGLRQSGTGWREAGTEALDVYSDWKTIYIHADPGAV